MIITGGIPRRTVPRGVGAAVAARSAEVGIMIIMRKASPRRTVLRGVGAAVAARPRRPES